jgi:hypothetical protein
MTGGEPCASMASWISRSPWPQAVRSGQPPRWSGASVSRQNSRTCGCLWRGPQMAAHVEIAVVHQLGVGHDQVLDGPVAWWRIGGGAGGHWHDHCLPEMRSISRLSIHSVAAVVMRVMRQSRELRSWCRRCGWPRGLPLARSRGGAAGTGQGGRRGRFRRRCGRRRSPTAARRPRPADRATRCRSPSRARAGQPLTGPSRTHQAPGRQPRGERTWLGRRRSASSRQARRE